MAPAISGFGWTTRRRPNIFAQRPNHMMDTDLIDKFVHGAFPFEQDFVEAAESAGIGHVPRVGDGHVGALLSVESQFLRISKLLFSDTLPSVIMFYYYCNWP